MAKPLVFEWSDRLLAFDMNKVDRSKLYGYKEVEVLDDHRRRCELAILAEDGRTVVGRGGTAFGQFSPDGTWRDKRELNPIDINGSEIQTVPSSFSAPVKLFDTATFDKYLRHTIRLVYQLTRGGDLSDLKFFSAARLKTDDRIRNRRARQAHCVTRRCRTSAFRHE